MIKMMNWNQLISAKRFGMEEFHEERQENRSEYTQYIIKDIEVEDIYYWRIATLNQEATENIAYRLTSYTTGSHTALKYPVSDVR